MDKNLDEIFDLIIAGESKRIISISNGVKVEKSPSYFRDMKRMYSKSWDTMYNPNNVFILYILVSIEFILRQLVDVDITVSTKARTYGSVRGVRTYAFGPLLDSFQFLRITS